MTRGRHSERTTRDVSSGNNDCSDDSNGDSDSDANSGDGDSGDNDSNSNVTEPEKVGIKLELHSVVL